MKASVSGILLRPAREPDADSIARVQFEAFQAAASAFYPAEVLRCWVPEPSPARGGDLRRALASDGQLWVVAESDGAVVACGALAVSSRELRGVSVAPSVARRGVGARIVAELEGLASARGITSLELVAPLNAEKFFVHLGYQVSGRHIERFGAAKLRMACLRMQKRLPAAAAGREAIDAEVVAPAASPTHFLAVYPIGDTDPRGLPVREVGPAIGYYTRVLGFTLVSRTKDTAVLARDAVQIGLAVNGKNPEQASCYIEVSGLAALHRELAACGIEPSDVREERPAGKLQRVFFAKEPFGVCFCFGQTER